MATSLPTYGEPGAFLLELLYFAGWHLDVRDDQTTTIRATRADVEVEVSGDSLDEAGRRRLPASDALGPRAQRLKEPLLTRPLSRP